jgi:DNA (cytosine-5)-methyltransferase 1
LHASMLSLKIHPVNQAPSRRSIDLFAGAGLLGYAFREAGFHARLAVEADHRARASYANNVGADEMSDDVRRVHDGVSASLVLAGPPCQGFSTLGKGDHSDERNSLSLCVSDWARSSNAQVVVVENVPPFLQSRHWALLKRRMRAMGYESTQWVLNAADFGAPQLRVRAFGIFSRIGLPERPAPTVTRHTTVRQAFEGLPVEPDDSGLHVAPKPGALALSRFQVIPENGDKRDVMRSAPHLCPPSWQKLGPQATDVWGRVDLDAPANTLRCSFQNASKGRYVHPTAHRVLTLREGARIQGVPDAWQFAGDRMSIARQIGNGVPLALGRAVATSIAALFTDDRGREGMPPLPSSAAGAGTGRDPAAKKRRAFGR